MTLQEIIENIKRDIFNACATNYHMPVKRLDCEQIFEIIDKYKVNDARK